MRLFPITSITFEIGNFDMRKMENQDIKNSVKEKWIEKYGVDNPAKTDEIRKKISDGVKPSRPLIRNIVQKKNFETFYNKSREK